MVNEITDSGLNITNSGLVGEFKSSGMIIHPDKARDFLAELRLLMEKYEIEKIDICWQHFNFTA